MIQNSSSSSYYGSGGSIYLSQSIKISGTSHSKKIVKKDRHGHKTHKKPSKGKSGH